MTVSRFYPYTTVPDGVQLEVGSTQPRVARADDGSLDVTDAEVEEITIDLLVSVDDATFEKVLPPEDIEVRPTKLVLIVRDDEGRRRQALPVQADGSVTVQLRRSDWVGLVDIVGVLARESGISDGSHDFGSHKGALLAWSEALHVRLDEPPERGGDLLPIRWVRFSERPDLRSRAAHLFALVAENPPELLLNSDVLELRAVLDSRGTHGAKARIRDAIFMQIAHQVWSSLLATALSDLATQARTTDAAGEELLAELTPWEAAVLRRWAPDLLPSVSAESVIDVLVETVVGPNPSELFIGRIPDAIQKKVQTFKAFDGLVKDSGLRVALEGE